MTQPLSVIIFGASGDLTSRKLIPALFHNFHKDRLPEKLTIVGVSRSEFSHEEFREKVREGMKQFAADEYEEAKWAAFAPHIFYLSGDATTAADFDKLETFLKEQEGDSADRLYYFSTAPSLYVPLIENLCRAGMMKENGGWRRIIVEKPFGYDLASAQELNHIIHSAMHEEQVYRIDHYLGKETAQNILFFRFGNTIFEPIWNRNYIDNVQITVAETVEVGHRAGYYDTSGVLRDMFQNHLLQLVALVAKEPPASFSAEALRNERIKVLNSIRPINLNDTVRAQYEGYLNEPGTNPNSETATFAALRLFIENWRWQGVPFYLRSGKALKTKTSEISIVFKSPPLRMFGEENGKPMEPNVLSLYIQPNEGIHLKFEAKVPRTLRETRSVDMDFSYAEDFNVQLPDAYERLLLDAIKGDAALFTRADEIEASWRIIDPIIQGWQTPAAPPLALYRRGTWGPNESNTLLGAAGHRWILESGGK